jgi:hypothetical protein
MIDLSEGDSERGGIVRMGRTRFVVLIAIFLLAELGPLWGQFKPEQEDVADAPGLPPIGKWMIDSSNKPADWLGKKYFGKNVREPINIIITDDFAGSAAEAKGKLVAACVEAGYESRPGHSSGYFGYINGVLYSQLPEEKDHAFSDLPFELSNNIRFSSPAITTELPFCSKRPVEDLPGYQTFRKPYQNQKKPILTSFPLPLGSGKTGMKQAKAVEGGSLA